jgi:hypothetical protein
VNQSTVQNVSWLGLPGCVLQDSLQPGDHFSRSCRADGTNVSGPFVTGRVVGRDVLVTSGVPVESSRDGLFAEVLESFPNGQAYVIGRRITDCDGRIPRGQHIFRPAHPLDQPATESMDFEEAISIDDVAVEMHGLSARFVSAFTATSGGTSQTFAAGSTHAIGAWNGVDPTATIGGFAIPKVLLAPVFTTVPGVREYRLALAGQRQAIERNASELARWRAREPEYVRNRAAWQTEETRLEELLQRRQQTYSRMWVRQMMFNRFDAAIDQWTSHYNTSLRPATNLDPNIVKSMLYQESRMGTSGEHLMPPPWDWNDGDRHPIRSRFNIGQAIDSWGPQQWLMLREMAPALATRHGLDALAARGRWFAMHNSDYSSHATFMLALREFFTLRSAGANLMGTVGKDLHEDYAFWIRTAIRWLFVKYTRLSTPDWSEAVRAYNGSGARAERYRDEVLARVGRTEALVVEGANDSPARHWGDAGGFSGTTMDDVVFGNEDLVIETAPSLDTSARLTWSDLTRVADSRGNPQVFYVVTGAPNRLAAVGHAAHAVFHLEVENTNSVYNHQDVTTKNRVMHINSSGVQHVVRNWSSARGSELEDQSSRVITLALSPTTLASAYNSDEPLTRLELEYHWRETFESSQVHFNRTGLTFALVAPIEFMLGRQRRLHSGEIELKEPQHRDDYWIPIGPPVNFTQDITTPYQFQLQVTTTIGSDLRLERTDTTTRSRSTSDSRTTSGTFSFEINGETSRGASAQANVGVLELGLTNLFKLGASLGYSRTRTDTSTTTEAREFSRALGLSQGYSRSQSTMTSTTVTVQPPAPPEPIGPSGTGSPTRRVPSTRRDISVGVYLYPRVAFFEVPYVRFGGINALGQATSRTEGIVAIPRIVSWGITTARN